MKKLLWKRGIALLSLWVLLHQPSYSSSYIYGYTPNAATSSMTWSMSPTTLGAYGIGGMDISGLIYTYNPIKELDDDFIVTVENDKVGGGFIFQDTEDWSGKHPVRIKKVIPLAYTPLALFGKGRVRTSGTGTLEDVSVIYMYRFDSCFNPQADPNCPGYVKPKPPAVPKIPDYDALEDDSVKLAQEDTDRELLEEDEEDRDDEDEEDDDSDLETLLASTTNALTLANQVAQSAIVNSINTATNIKTYYVANIPDSYITEYVVLQGGNVVDNRKALRSLAQDNLMNQMIEEQYK